MEENADPGAFTPDERQRYARHFALPGFGEAGQRRLKEGSVLVVGAGGLGSPVLLYLAAAGVGRIGIVDPDRVDASNLQRQVLYTLADVGELKAEAARLRLLTLNPHIQVDAYPLRLTRHNALDLIAQYDVVADGTDNFPTRYLVNDACVLAGKVNVYASIFRYEGQVSVFNYPGPDGQRGVQYRDLFPTPPPPGLVPDCATGGVLGVLPGIIGSLQATEVIKVLSATGEPLAGRLLVLDAATMLTRVLKLHRNPDLMPPAELIDYEEFCGLQSNVPSVSPAELRHWQDEGIPFQLIDVRERDEYKAVNLGGKLIPLGELPGRLDEVPRDQTVVLLCQSGQRSARATALLIEAGFTAVYNLEGGLEAWGR